MKQTFKKYQDEIFTIVLFTGAILLLIISLMSSCYKDVQKGNLTLIIPVAYNENGCPYPPGCNKYITDLALTKFQASDINVNVKMSENNLLITTQKPGNYLGIQKIDLVGNNLILQSNNKAQPR